MKVLSHFAGPMGLVISLCFLLSCGPQPKEQAESTEEAVEEEEIAVAAPEEVAPEATLVVMHQVADFDAWKAAFDEHKSLREAAGLTDGGVFRQEGNPNMVAVGSSVSDMGKAQEFISSDDLKSVMENAGVTGQPEITFIKPDADIDGESPSTDYLSVRHEVTDYAVWRAAFDADAANRQGAGLVLRNLSTNLDNANEVWILFAVTDRAATDAFIGSPELAKVMEEAGVVGEPQITFWSLAATDAM